MGCGAIFAICTRCNVLFLSSVAIGGSLLTTISCRFFTYTTLDGQVWEGLEGPFQDLPEASVGLFGYSEATTSTALVGDSCERFNDWKLVGQSDVFQVAQVAAICAPLLGFLAWIQIVLEFLCCRLYGGFVLMSSLFLLTAAVQACTFLVFADTQFCLEPESVNECQFEAGAYISFGAMILYAILACLVSNIPASPGQRNDGCLIKTGWKSGPHDRESTSHPLVISTHGQADPEMALSMETKETQKGVESLNQEQQQEEQQQAVDDDAIEGEEIGKEEGEEMIEEEEILVIEDENGEHVVMEEEIMEEEVVEVEEGEEVQQPASEGGDGQPRPAPPADADPSNQKAE
ncbi:unnamed protein product [Cylindrotheca closterium]|uniref:Uncharacterized protein n=1 Tax=Cylindrotheca closterium TaxID=2856 RepID=A0AAD2CFX4_9STRA|nr:unnamed protein product [Cylindrotheca closterium]